MIEAVDIRVGYDRHLIIDGVSLTAGPGDVVGLIGPNGCGKTTLLRTLYAALKPWTGTVLLDGAAMAGLRGADISRRVAVAVQDTPSDLPITVADMVLLGRSPHRGALAALTRDDHRIAAASLTHVGARDLAHRTLSTLSGGERQRVVLARALTQQADHLLLDEPTNHLDIRYQHELLRLVRALPVTSIVVLHDLNLAARYCSHLILLHQGRVAAAGAPEDVLTEEVVRSVYGIDVHRVTVGGRLQLIFEPLGEGGDTATVHR